MKKAPSPEYKPQPGCFGETEKAPCGHPITSQVYRCRECLEAAEAREKALLAALASLAVCEANYRIYHDECGASDIKTGHAWDRMRQAGDAARELLGQEELERNEGDK